MIAHHEDTRDPIISSDLSNATDRLPVDLQKDILLCLGLRGDLWANILDRPYLVLEPPKRLINYTVGQPMGVLSSFVMLSLTNHFINTAALQASGHVLEPGHFMYSVLGDDQACRSSLLAKWYSILLGQLGVRVNPIKGFNGNICEFAKRLFFQIDGRSFDLSPIGAKVVLQAMHNPIYAVSLLQDMNNKKYTLSNAVSLLSTYLTNLFPRGKTPLEMKACQIIYLFALLGPQSGLYDLSRSDYTVNLFKLDFDRLLESFGSSSDKYFEYFSHKSLDRWARPHDLLVMANTLAGEF